MLDRAPQDIPSKPGCYIFRDARKRPLYVGKAKNLRSRVGSYFTGKVPAKILRLRQQAAQVEFILTASEWEAFLLENNLIKQFRPRFNTLLKDDKTYPYLKLTVKDRYPRAVFTRRAEKDGALYFGPFVPGWQAKKNLRILQEHFRVATCKDPLDGSRPRPCLYYEMGQCFAPCMKGWVTEEQYRAAVEQARYFLEGRTQELQDELKRRMLEASSKQDFELAAYYRDLAQAARALGGHQAVSRPGEGHWDFFALYGGGESYVLHGFVVLDGKVVDRRRWRFDDVEFGAGELFAAFLSRFYGNASVIPDGVAVSAEFEDLGLVERFLSERKGKRVPLVFPRRGTKAALIATLMQNARLEFETNVDPAAVVGPLAHALGLPAPPRRIECFDVSHSHGEETVASCVVWEAGAMDKREYRTFRVRSGKGEDDFASLSEAVSRRYRKVVEESSELPDLVLIDGGLGQVNAAHASLSSILPQVPPMAGLAKREEWLFLPRDSTPVRLPKESPSLRLLMSIRDEAHRFAVAAHRRRRGKSRLSSPLLDVPGIGPVTAKKLLRAFLSTDAVRAAPLEKLERAVGKRAAAAVRAWAEARSGESERGREP
jgi:excinuclease ABC subunit C